MIGLNRFLFFRCFLVAMAALLPQSALALPEVEQILRQIGTDRGICCLLDDPTGELAIGLARVSDLIVYVQLPDDRDVEKCRQAAEAAGFLGTRVFVEQGESDRIHLADNLADVVIASDNAPEHEVLRVLRPEGKALLGGRELTKPLPDGVDEWSHPNHGPDNNPRSTDRIARAPYLTQFLAKPHYGPVPTNTVAAAGRLFRAFGNIAFKTREEPYLNTLVAFNGYNGTILWTYPLVPGIMVHRNTMIATPEVLYLADDRSCKLLDTATGRLVDEIAPPAEVAGGTFWKWMALEDGVLYALIGEQELKDAVTKWGKDGRGWSWDAVSKGYNQERFEWGFGRTLLAIDPWTKQVLWHYREAEPIDARSVCMKNGHLYFHRFGSYLGCLDTKIGKIVWRKNQADDPQLFSALGDYLEERQGWETGWRSMAYARCSDKALYLAGPQLTGLTALSAQDGSILWTNPYDNFQLILADNVLFGISGGPWRTWEDDKGGSKSRKFEPLTGAVLASYDLMRRGCTRVTASADSLLFRAMGGSQRIDLATEQRQYLSPMRPPCFDGVIVSNGLLYWPPFCCDCQLTLYGFTCVGPAGDFNFNQQADDAQRCRKGPASAPSSTEPLTGKDWPVFRADNQGTAASEADIPADSVETWLYRVPVTAPTTTITAPTAAYGLVYFGGSDGMVRALGAADGQLKWKAYTGGAIRLPPTLWNGRAYVGSADGWVYCLNALTGKLIWRFRAAPVERKIPVYGSLMSTWPVAGGVLVEKGVVYAAAGIVNYDGTHVYALDAESGRIIWQNNASGMLDPQSQAGISVQGHMLVSDSRLYLAGGNAISPAVYDLADGRCLNDDFASVRRCESIAPRGWELFKVGDQVVACGQPFYGDPQNPVFDEVVYPKALVTRAGDRHIVWQDNERIACYNRITQDVLNGYEPYREDRGFKIVPWGKLDVPEPPLWTYFAPNSKAVAVCRNAVVVAGESAVMALDISTGQKLWSGVEHYRFRPVPWGLAVDRDGRVFVAHEDGLIHCYASGGRAHHP